MCGIMKAYSNMSWMLLSNMSWMLLYEGGGPHDVSWFLSHINCRLDIDIDTSSTAQGGGGSFKKRNL